MPRTQTPIHRRKLLSGLFAVVMALLPLSRAIAAVHHRDAKLEIMDLEQQWRIATLNADVSLMDELLSDDFVGISWTGQVNNKMSQLDRLRASHIKITRMEISDLKIRIVGPVAIVTSSAQLSGTNDGIPIDGTFRYTRVYQQLAGAWKITNFEATRVPNGGHSHGRRLPPSPPPADQPFTPSVPATTPHSSFRAALP